MNGATLNGVTHWTAVQRGEDRVWIAKRGGVIVGAVSCLACDTGYHPMRIRDPGPGGTGPVERYPLPAQPLLEHAMRYVELVNGDYWPTADEQLELTTGTAAEQLELDLPPGRFVRVEGGE